MNHRHGFEACKTCENRHTHCKSVKVKNCMDKTQKDLLIKYVREKSFTEKFEDKCKEMAA